MSRKKIETADVIEADDVQTETALVTLRADVKAQQLALAQNEASVRAIAAQIGYNLPADCTDPDLIQRDVAANMRRTVEAMVEVGRGLLVLREACGHGEFMSRLDVLGFEPRAAQRYMQVVRKFANASTSTHLLTAAGTQSKLLEMLVLDDEQVEELELHGQTGELKLDEIASLSVKELRAKLRELKADNKAQAEILAEKNASLDDLRTQQKRIATATPDERLAEMQTEATRHFNDVRGQVVGQLRAALQALSDHAAEHGAPARIFAAGLAGQLTADLTALRTEFDLPTLDTNEHGWIEAE